MQCTAGVVKNMVCRPEMSHYVVRKIHYIIIITNIVCIFKIFVHLDTTIFLHLKIVGSMFKNKMSFP